jgi:hypothetical protein
MRLEADRLVLRPVVPPSLGGTRTATGVRYRGATLAIEVRGFGDDVATARLDGQPLARAEVPATVTGAHRIEITMNGHWPASGVHLVPNRFAPLTTRATLVERAFSWPRVPGATEYVVYRNGMPLQHTRSTSVLTHPGRTLAEYQELAVDSAGDQSFLSEPVRVIDPGAELLVKPNGVPLQRDYSGFSSAGYARLTRDANTVVSFGTRVAEPGVYAIDVRYANGSGPVNTADKVAVRTLLVDGDTAGVIVMPQRGENRWSDWGWSNVLHVRLAAGAHTLTLAFTPLDENMNRHVNTALLDALRLTPLESGGEPTRTNSRGTR